MRLEPVDENMLPEAIRTRLAELRACNNVECVDVLGVSGGGAVVCIVPNDLVAEGGGFAMPDKPHLMLIPSRAH